ncbi:hypothetical protein GUITHDRAFT_107431 [Guillardia theta CCMP2712]|uniref:PDZ domain-containing protein n=1 Tax=Guillardia theta (strain CCMP2712) TaxID=905079 RepID=L1JEA2_GUITC|nr:hypothetical protein GUITHDRAFT_107431 [Guillardia theta CCMP2712]EKX46647.1 hypothetical protein GUITHDRAFT_107431 [Guillardia theta CCMP2712]|eukprot:XP_005833627.1 hypothetical protein GUITHDRAFT_107431 [Guillardia theta CCMP2712]
MSSERDKESLEAENERLRREIERMRMLLQRQEKPDLSESDLGSLGEQSSTSLASSLPEQKGANEAIEDSVPASTLLLDGSWQEYDPEICMLIEQAYQGGQRAVCPSHNTVLVFGDMEEQSVEDGEGKVGVQPLYSKPVKRHRSFGRSPVLLALRRRNLVYKEASLRARTEALILHDKSNSADAESMAEVGIGCSLGHDPLSGNIFIAHIRTDSAAALSGRLAAGDVLVSIDGERVTKMEDASLLIGPVGSVVEVEVRYDEKVERVSVVRKSYAPNLPMHTFMRDLEQAEQRYRFDVGVEVDLVGGIPMIVRIREGSPAACSTSLMEGDQIMMIDDCDVINDVVPLESIVQMLEGSPWSRVKLMVARAYPWAPSSPKKKAEKKKRARQEEEQPAQVNMSEFEVELVRGPDLNAEGIRAKLEFEELVKAKKSLQESLKASAKRQNPLMLAKNAVKSVEELKETAQDVVAKAQENFAAAASQVTDKVEESVAPLLEQRWQVLQFGSQVSGLVRNAVSNITRGVSEQVNVRIVGGEDCRSISMLAGNKVESLEVNGEFFGCEFDKSRSQAWAANKKVIGQLNVEGRRMLWWW